MQYISVKGDVIEVNPYAIYLSMELNRFGSTTSGVYSRAVFMTVFAQHTVAIT